MDGWMSGWVDDWMDGCMDGWIILKITRLVFGLIRDNYLSSAIRLLQRGFATYSSGNVVKVEDYVLNELQDA
jgi:hypothetical protein